jgi:benzoyl-CoA 2,3-dioxygenase component B
MEANYQDRIPNNISLTSNRTLQRALEHWQPEFLNWWHGLGPSDFNASDVYLRTAISVDTKGWATFGYVRMPEYRWGIFLADPEVDRRVASATTTASRSGSRFPANIVPRCAA